MQLIAVINPDTFFLIMCCVCIDVIDFQAAASKKLTIKLTVDCLEKWSNLVT